MSSSAPARGFRWRTRHTVVAALVGAVVVGGGVGAALTLGASPPRGTPGATGGGTASTSGPRPSSASPSPKPTRSPSSKPTDPLTGGSPSGNEVIAVKIENIAAARPQVGLSAADIVFAEQVEGAQTRLIAIYHSSFPTRLGPVRSARTTDVQLLPLFGKPGLVYSGANARVQRKIDAASIVPIARSTRDNRRFAPHNVFVDLRSIAADVRVGRAKSIGWVFGGLDGWQDAKRAGTASARIGHDTFRFSYADGRYTVYWNGVVYRDGDSGTITRTDNVVIMNVHDHGDGNRDVNGVPSVVSDTVGSGRVSVYRDGRVLSGTWSRSSVSAPLRFRDGSGHDLVLKPGRTWVGLKG